MDDMNTVSLDTLIRAKQEIDRLSKPDQWIVIDPQGRMYKGKIEDVTRVILSEHPFTKNASTKILETRNMKTLTLKGH